MYAGSTIRRRSGWLLGVHQRIDRVARRHFTKHLPSDVFFPSKNDILHFEGNNGPDAIKRKSPSRDEPWHFIDPAKPNDHALIDLINDHYANLAKALQRKNKQRAAFEAAWLSHAIVDGLTPAHHFPLADKIEELWGKPHYERSSVRDKNIIKGKNRRDSVSKNWQYWGSGGIFSRHFLFEFGVATSILFHPFRDIGITEKDLKDVEQKGIEPIFRQAMKDIVQLDVYNKFTRQGWTHVLATESREVLVPRIMKTVFLAWYGASKEAQT